MLKIAPTVWPATLEQFRRCGRGRAECVVYWLAGIDAPDRVETIVHPVHSGTAGMYSVSKDWLTPFFASLHAERRTVRVQVHTHAHEAYHSVTDDEWPLVTTPGFLSLVLPNFAEGPIPPRDLFLAELDARGRWNRVEVIERIAGLP